MNWLRPRHSRRPSASVPADLLVSAPPFPVLPTPGQEGPAGTAKRMEAAAAHGAAQTRPVSGASPISGRAQPQGSVPSERVPLEQPGLASPGAGGRQAQAWVAPPQTEEEEREELELALVLSRVSALEEGLAVQDLGSEAQAAPHMPSLAASSAGPTESRGAGPGPERQCHAGVQRCATVGHEGPGTWRFGEQEDPSRGRLNQCSVCMDSPADGACVPCGHVCACLQCLTALHKKRRPCPVCNNKVREIIRIYLS